jgi:hypothetical protein
VQVDGEDGRGLEIAIGDSEPGKWAVRRETGAIHRRCVPLVDSLPQLRGGLCCRENWCSMESMVGYNVSLQQPVGEQLPDR